MKMDIAIPELGDVRFVKRCGRCRGTGRVDFLRDDAKGLKAMSVECCSCGGVGKVLTPVGDRLINFLRAYGIDVGAMQWQDVDAD